MDFNPTETESTAETAVEATAEETRTENYEGGTAYLPDSPEGRLFALTINNLVSDTYYRSDEEALAELRQAFESCAVHGEDPEFPLRLAAYAREEMYLRDVPQVLLVLSAHHERTKPHVAEWAPHIIQRADEPMRVLGAWEALYGPPTMPRRIKAAADVAVGNKSLSAPRVDEVAELVDADRLQEAIDLVVKYSTFSEEEIRTMGQRVPNALRKGINAALNRQYAMIEDSNGDRRRREFDGHDGLGTLAAGAEVVDQGYVFDEYALAKYDRDSRAWNLKDVFNVTHPEAPEPTRQDTHDRIMWGELDDHPAVEPLDTPHTWEVELSARGSSAEVWRDVLPDMGLFAIIRNLRNMREAGLEGEEIIDQGDLNLEWVRNSYLYPFRFYQAYAALRDADRDVYDEALAEWLGEAIETAVENLPDFDGDTFVAVDTSGSMDQPVSGRSELTQREIGAVFGAALASRGADVGAFASDYEEVRAHHDTPLLELVEKIENAGPGGSTYGWRVMRALRDQELAYDRIIYLTDMQMYDDTPGVLRDNENTVREEWHTYRSEMAGEVDPTLYLVDLASYGDLQVPSNEPQVFNIRGWSEKVFDLIELAENSRAALDDVKAYAPE